MKKLMRNILGVFTLLNISSAVIAQQSHVAEVNVFLGSSGDHGQMSPAASYPFGMLSIGPETYPFNHTGYEYKAKLFKGFTHSRMEGVGCRGSGGNILIKPFSNGEPDAELIKQHEQAAPGYYAVSFTNGLTATMAVYRNSGVEQYTFKENDNGVVIDLSYAHANGFRGEQHTLSSNTITGWIESGTTCREGAYRFYYCLSFSEPMTWNEKGSVLAGKMDKHKKALVVNVGLSAVSVQHAEAALFKRTLDEAKSLSQRSWENLLSQIEVKGDKKEQALFYSLLYRTLQSPYLVSEGKDSVFNGWAVWDNYRTQLPLLALLSPELYQPIVSSLANLYKQGKKDWATFHEPSNSVRTEHTIVVLLDALRKKYHVDFRSILDSLRKENDSLDFAHPDKALESSYDTWALSEICRELGENDLAKFYRDKALGYKKYWLKDFKDLSKADIDRMGARGMYQGTIWQYRWLVPYDAKGLVELCGGDSAYRKQLDVFFKDDYYSATNETDIQAPAMYNASSEQWKSQDLIRRYAQDTVVQLYTDQNVRGVNPIIGRVYNNRPDAYVLAMDDDAGAMSAWYVFAAAGLMQPCVGSPYYYLHVPLFNNVLFKAYGFSIEVRNFSSDNRYIQSVVLNGKPLDRLWITHDEIVKGGKLIIEASAKPNKTLGVANAWSTEMGK